MNFNRRILAINGSIRGAAGNTARLLDVAAAHLPGHVQLRQLVLATYQGTVEELVHELDTADGLLLGTGVYWSGWGSPLQRFIEIMTAWEAAPTFVGKPAVALVSMDSVGGSEVAARLLGVMSMLGCLVPPFPAVVVSRIGAQVRDAPGNEDVWQEDDVAVLMHNLVLATELRAVAWQTWPVKSTIRMQGPYPTGGALELGSPHWLHRRAL